MTSPASGLCPFSCVVGHALVFSALPSRLLLPLPSGGGSGLGSVLVSRRRCPEMALTCEVFGCVLVSLVLWLAAPISISLSGGAIQASSYQSPSGIQGDLQNHEACSHLPRLSRPTRSTPSDPMTHPSIFRHEGFEQMMCLAGVFFHAGHAMPRDAS